MPVNATTDDRSRPQEASDVSFFHSDLDEVCSVEHVIADWACDVDVDARATRFDDVKDERVACRRLTAPTGLDHRTIGPAVLTSGLAWSAYSVKFAENSVASSRALAS